MKRERAEPSNEGVLQEEEEQGLEDEKRIGRKSL
jgi:hypothetical protein